MARMLQRDVINTETGRVKLGAAAGRDATEGAQRLDEFLQDVERQLDKTRKELAHSQAELSAQGQELAAVGSENERLNTHLVTLQQRIRLLVTLSI